MRKGKSYRERQYNGIDFKRLQRTVSMYGYGCIGRECASCPERFDECLLSLQKYLLDDAAALGEFVRVNINNSELIDE